MSNNRKKIKLREIANITMGQSPSSKFYNNFGYGLPFLQGNRTFGDKYPTFDTWTNSPTKIAEKNDVIMSVRAPVGDLNITPVQMCLGRGVCSIRSLSGNNEFIYYSLKNAMKVISANGSKGTVFDSINRNDLENIEIFLPTNMEEQIDISTILSNIDSLIENNKKFSTTLEEAAKSLYDYWFTQFDFPDENGKPYRTSSGKMVWNEELKKEIPEGWKIGNIYSIANLINGLACQKYRPQKGDIGLPVVKIKEMHEGLTSDTESVSSNIPKKYIINNGDILFSWSATLEVMYWYGGKAGLNQHIFKVAPNNDFPLEYIYHQLAEYIVTFSKIALSRRTTMGHITSDHISQSRIALAPISLAKEYAKIVSPFYEKIDSLQQENQTLTSLRDYLLPLLMNGQVTIAD